MGLGGVFVLGSDRGGAQAGSEYVGGAVCSQCHGRIAASYAATGMGRSVSTPGTENLATPKRLFNQASDRYYTILERGGKLYERRHQTGWDGKETNVVEKQAEWVIGSGNHARTYVYRDAEGRLMEMPVSWYEENGGYWEMSPGYDRRDQQDFRRAVSYDCIFCHAAYPAPPPSAEAARNGRIFGGGAGPKAIDCERCHGPGRAHVEAARSGRAHVETIRRAIVNPAGLSRDRQLEICMECHLETTSRPLPHVLFRFDRGPFSYRPGQPLGEFLLNFDRAPAQNDSFEIAHAAYRLRQSACFKASQMACTTCHNPHEAPRGEAAVQHYVSVCRGCHATAHAAKSAGTGSCLDCHMPKRRADDAVHTVMTDHYIQRNKPAGDLRAPLTEAQEENKSSYRGEVVLYYPPQLPATAETELYLSAAQVDQGSNLGSGIPRLEGALSKYQPARPEFYLELGEAYSKSGKPETAIRWYNEALRRRPEFHAALQHKAAALIAGGQLPDAARVLESAVGLPDADAVDWTNLGNVYFRQGDRAKAAQALQRGIAKNAEVPDAHNSLGLVQLQSGDSGAAERSFREAIRLQPDLAEAHNNLANLLAGRREYREAAWHFQKATASNPSYVEAHYRYGLLMVLLREYGGAVAELEETVRLDPKRADAHSDLGDVLAASGKADRAEQEYRLAIQADPNLFEAHLSLGMLLRGKGASAEAREHLLKASQSPDPDLRRAALDALR